MLDLNRARTVLALITALAVLGAAAQGGETRRFKSRSYDITTDLPDEQAKHVAEHMDAVHREYSARFNAYGKRNNEPLRLWVFETRDGYAEFLAGLGINSTGSGGMFFRRPEASGLISYVGGRGMDSMLETLRHEGMHQFLYQRIGDGLPQWLNEGMAEWFGYALEAQRGFEMGLADPIAVARLRQTKQDNQLLPLGDLLTMSHSEWNQRVQTGIGGVQYDQSWSVVHFLAFAQGGRFAPMLDQLLQLLWQGMEPERAVNQVFGNDVATMEKAWHEYLDELEPDELYLALDTLSAHALVLEALHKKDVSPKTPQELEQAIDDHGASLELPEVIMTSLGERPLTFEQDAWWRTPPSAARNDREAVMRLIPDRRGAEPAGIELRGLKRRVVLTWSTDREGNLSHEIALR